MPERWEQHPDYNIAPWPSGQLVKGSWWHIRKPSIAGAETKTDPKIKNEGVQDLSSLTSLLQLFSELHPVPRDDRFRTHRRGVEHHPPPRQGRPDWGAGQLRIPPLNNLPLTTSSWELTSWNKRLMHCLLGFLFFSCWGYATISLFWGGIWLRQNKNSIEL